MRAVVDTAVDGVILISAQGIILMFNPACERLFGYAAFEVVGRNVKMLMPEPYQSGHDSYLTNYRESGVRKIIGIGREVLGRKRSGATFPMYLSVGEAEEDGNPIYVGIIRDLTELKTAEEAVRQADIICTATTSSTPVFDGRDLRPGVHINAVGAYTPQMQEVDAETIRRATVVIDSRHASLAEAGDLIIPLQQGLISESHIQAELGEIVLGRKPGRQSEAEITYFKSVGVAVQDVAAARLVLAEAARQGLGVEVEL